MPKKSRQCMKGNNQICLTVWLYIDCITIHWLYYYTLTVLLYIDYTVYTMAIAFYTFLGAWILSKKEQQFVRKDGKHFFPWNKIAQNLWHWLWICESRRQPTLKIACYGVIISKPLKGVNLVLPNGPMEEERSVTRWLDNFSLFGYSQ